MSVFAIADTHLCFGRTRPMDRFGGRWQNYTDKLSSRWRAVVDDDDTVVVPGDVSWAMTLEEAAPDFAFLDALPGRKLIGKGNHDYWWTSTSKLRAFCERNGFGTISFVHNGASRADDISVAMTRGWFYDESAQDGAPAPTGEPDYDKLVAREAVRLRTSLEAARESGGEIVAFLHFPPVFGGFVCESITGILEEYGVRRCYYGHIHGVYALPRTFSYSGVDYTIISADYLDFTPYPVSIT